jgi:hypothetical protein
MDEIRQCDFSPHAAEDPSKGHQCSGTLLRAAWPQRKLAIKTLARLAGKNERCEPYPLDVSPCLLT